MDSLCISWKNGVSERQPLTKLDRIIVETNLSNLSLGVHICSWKQIDVSYASNLFFIPRLSYHCLFTILVLLENFVSLFYPNFVSYAI